MATATEILQALHDSEINGSVAWFFDGGITWRLGDDLNGWRDEGGADTLNDAVVPLAFAAVKRYPASEFAKWWEANRPMGFV